MSLICFIHWARSGSGEPVNFFNLHEIKDRIIIRINCNNVFNKESESSNTKRYPHFSSISFQSVL